MHTTFISYNSSNSYNTVDFTAETRVPSWLYRTVTKYLMNMRHVLWHNLFLTHRPPSYCLFLPGELLLDFHWLTGIKLDPETHCKRLLSCWRQERHSESEAKDGAWKKGITHCTNCLKRYRLMISSVGMVAQLVHRRGAFLTPHLF